ncbi:MAG: glycogen debranching protein GlgX [Spirochaetales bacterium]|nr:glycogen debranching protein GlgX [Spirochaetales bacterium]
MRKLRHFTNLSLSSGESRVLGAQLTPGGVNFALFSRYAQEVYLLLFSDPHEDPTDCIKIENRTDHVWHVFVRGITKGQLYGYKVKGPYDPGAGLRFNEYKLLLDPYAKAITPPVPSAQKGMYGYDPASTEKDLSYSEYDNCRIAPKSIVIDDDFDWQGVTPPGLSREELIIYETHVRGFTKHPSSQIHSPGTYAGFIEKIPYLKELGINAVELLPVHQHYIGSHLTGRGLSEYWGYNTICFFAPELHYSTGEYPGSQVFEFKTMVRELHRAGIEVILDVVYNHTGEGSEVGPTLCFRGIDNLTYYRLWGPVSEPHRFYVNDSGCGNTMNCEHPQVLKLIMDSLRYWTEKMGVDGFRFDLAPLVAREKGTYDKNAAFFQAIFQDPVLQNVKLIAEPWDLTSNQLGNFPEKWSEWNGKFSTTSRKFLRGDQGQMKDLAWRLTGSADLYETSTKYPCNSINFITCHDGFTLNDLFSYNHKHNKENGEQNRDGQSHNHSCNCGIEGVTTSLRILRLRNRMIRNALCLLLFSLGTPMICGGDERGRTQQGNNNPYCQDNEISWFHWDPGTSRDEILNFTRKAIDFRKRYSILYKKLFYSGKDGDRDSVPDILWFDENLRMPKWDDPNQKILCYQIDGSEVPSPYENYHLFFILNGGSEDSVIKLPENKGMRWHRVVDTYRDPGEDFLNPGQEKILPDQQAYSAGPQSIVVLLGKEMRQ